jgi:prepilin-type N-terminal cleavage/methylation domain-containing protein
MSGQRGLTFIEILVSLVILSVAIAGLVSLWAFGFNTTQHSQDLGVAYHVARQEIERAKNISFLLLPEATWSSGYDGNGHPTAEAVPHFTADVAIETIPDANGELNTRCLRRLHVHVTSRDKGGTLFETVTYLTRGGV